MDLKLGTFDYRIRFTDEQLFLNRKSVLAICDHPRRELLVSNLATGGQLRQIIGEAVARIWSYRFPEAPGHGQVPLSDGFDDRDTLDN